MTERDLEIWLKFDKKEIINALYQNLENEEILFKRINKALKYLDELEEKSFVYYSEDADVEKLKKILKGEEI